MSRVETKYLLDTKTLVTFYSEHCFYRWTNTTPGNNCHRFCSKVIHQTSLSKDRSDQTRPFLLLPQWHIYIFYRDKWYISTFDKRIPTETLRLRNNSKWRTNKDTRLNLGDIKFVFSFLLKQMCQKFRSTVYNFVCLFGEFHHVSNTLLHTFIFSLLKVRKRNFIY